MTNVKISQKDIYDAITSLRNEIIHQLETAEARCTERYGDLKKDVDANTGWRNKVAGQIAVVVGIVAVVVNFVWDLFTKT